MRFSRSQQWVNPLMGWTSSRDPLADMTLRFDSLEAALAFAHQAGRNFVKA